MAAKKVYAVRSGKVIGILDSWDACREAVEGYPGAEYKSFKSLEEAKAYMEGTADTKGTAVQEDFQKEEIKPLREKSGTDDGKASKKRKAADTGRKKEVMSERTE